MYEVTLRMDVGGNSPEDAVQAFLEVICKDKPKLIFEVIGPNEERTAVLCTPELSEGESDV